MEKMNFICCGMRTNKNERREKIGNDNDMTNELREMDILHFMFET